MFMVNVSGDTVTLYHNGEAVRTYTKAPQETALRIKCRGYTRPTNLLGPKLKIERAKLHLVTWIL